MSIMQFQARAIEFQGAYRKKVNDMQMRKTAVFK